MIWLAITSSVLAVIGGIAFACEVRAIWRTTPPTPRKPVDVGRLANWILIALATLAILVAVAVRN